MTAAGISTATGVPKKVPPRAVTRGGGGLPGTVPPVAFDWPTLTLVTLDTDGHWGLAFRLASTRHSITSFRPLSKGGFTKPNSILPKIPAAVNENSY